MVMYLLELEKAINLIDEHKSKTVCVQLPEGLKPKARLVVDKIFERTGAVVYIWLGSNFGACDIPLGLQRMQIDLLLCWGHNRFHKMEGW